MRTLVILLIISLSIAGIPSTAAHPYRIKDQTNTFISVLFTLPDTVIQKNGRFSKISPNHLSRTTENLNPDLPVYSGMVLLKPGKSYEFEMIIKQSHQVFDVYPSPSTISTDSNTMNLSDFNYSKKQGVFPKKQFNTYDPMIMRGNHIIQYSLIPFQYHYKTGTLDVIDEAEIRITETGLIDRNTARTQLRSRALEPLLSSMVINYLPGDDDEYQQPSILYICGGNSLSNPVFQSLLQWRREEGYIVYTAAMSDIGTETTDVENYLQTAYNTFTPPPEFIALVGDTGGAFQIPTYYEHWSQCSYNEPCNGEGDFPYTQLEGNDLLPEALIGRISVRNNTSLSIVCSKTMNYEKGLNADAGWFEKASLAANPDIYGNGLSIVTTNEYIRDLLESNGMEDVTLNIQPNMAAVSYWLNNQLDQGVSFLNFRGLYGPASFDIDIIMDQLQTHTMLPFVTFITCGTGSFAYEAAAPIERFLRSGNSPGNVSGGVAAIGTATYGTHTPFNNIVDMGIYHGIFSLGVETAGAALAAGELALLNTYPDNPSNYVSIFTHWNNLMGDPALRLWTDTPDSLQVIHPAILMPGSNSLNVTVRNADGTPVENAAVSILSENYDSAALQMTNTLGEVQFPVTTDMDGYISLTVTKRNYFPYQNNIEIHPDGPVVMLASPVIIDDQITGNGDGMINPGETVQMTTSFLITGGEISTGGEIELSCTMAEITGSPCNFSPVSDGDTISCVFGLTVSPEPILDSDVQLTAYIQDLSDNEWQVQIPVTVSGSRLRFTDVQTFDPGSLLPGSEISLNMRLENTGQTESGVITGELHSSDEHGIIILSEDISFDSILPGETGESTLDPVIKIPDSAIWGSSVNLVLSLVTASDEQIELILPASLGESTVAEPVGPDEYGYYMYGAEDRYNLASDYFWIEIDPHYGGMGTPLQMIDCGMGEPYDQGPVQIELPFIFQFYGEEYTSVSVSTNGWLSFGSTELASFRNTPVPGPGGPSPMAAVFWDDLKTYGENGYCNGSAYGDVFYYEDPDGQFVIFEWSDLKTAQNEDPEAFQAILYNTRGLTPTGDNEIQFQYKIFNNTSNGLYLPGYNGLIHGSYSTIGLEDHTESRGLQYTFNNEYDEQAEPLQNESSLFITTRYPQNLFTAGPTIGVPPLTVTFEAVETGEDILHEWDVDGDGIIDGTGDYFQWTYEDFGHYTVTVFQTRNGTTTSEYKLNVIHTVTEGCTDPIAENYNPAAEFNDGSCIYIYGCLDPEAANYNESATMDNGNCFYMPYDELTVPGIYFNAYFGSDTDMEGDMAVVGAYNDSTGNMMSTGAAYIFKLNSSGTWDMVTKLTAFDAQSMDYYGFSVDISGNRVAVGSYQDDNEKGVNAGSVYIYHENHAGVWELEEKIIPDDGEQSDNFGYSVKFNNTLLAVNSRKDNVGENSNQGSVYFYQYSDGVGWNLIQNLTPEDGESGDSFGRAMDMSENYFVAGSPLADANDFVNTGKIYLFENDGISPWVSIQTITPIDLQTQDQFGTSVSLSDNYLMIGAPYNDVNDIQNSGSVYVYRNNDGMWLFDDFISDETAEINDNFGKDTAIDGDYFVVHSGNKIVIFHLEENGQWLKTAEFESPVAGAMVINENRVLTGNLMSNNARIYYLDEWENWLNNSTPGDVNNDTNVDVLDAVLMVAYIMGEIELSDVQLSAAELNGDGTVDVLDAVILIALILQPSE